MWQGSCLTVTSCHIMLPVTHGLGHTSASTLPVPQAHSCLRGSFFAVSFAWNTHLPSIHEAWLPLVTQTSLNITSSEKSSLSSPSNVSSLFFSFKTTCSACIALIICLHSPFSPVAVYLYIIHLCFLLECTC